MANNIRNARTTHPRKAARRERAAQRFCINPARANDAEYMKAKATEAKSLGLAI